jgi:hypothetical protein
LAALVEPVVSSSPVEGHLHALFLIVLQLAFGVFGSNPMSDMLAGVVAYLPKVIAAILIIVIAAAMSSGGEGPY